jgi:putative glutamine amidotransferase
MARLRPLIGLTTYGENQEHRFSLPVEYVAAIRRAGGSPVLLPPGEGDLGAWLELIDALVLPGGGDVEPSRYGGAPHPENYKVDPARDADEIAMARHAVDARLPMLAICRGMQVLNVAFGGTLIPHVPDVVGERVLHRAPPKRWVPHEVAVERGSRVAEVMSSTQCTIASSHHQAVDRLAAPFRIVGRAPDGIVEAMELPGHPFLLAVQWHPELTAADDPLQQRLFDALVRAV